MSELTHEPFDTREPQVIQSGTEPKFKVGQKVYIVPSDSRYHAQADYHEITKIGRKWIYFIKYRQESRFDPVTMRVDNGGCGSWSIVYMTREEFAEVKEIGKLWSALKDQVYGYTAPKHLTRKDLEEIIQKLKGEQHDG